MNKTRTFLILITDIAAFYLSLFLTLILKYGNSWQNLAIPHLMLFSCFLPAWMVISYIFDLWQTKIFKNQTMVFLRLFGAICVLGLSCAVFIYLFSGFFKISPRSNLLIFCLMFFILDFAFKTALKEILSKNFKIKTFLIGESKVSKEIILALESNPHMGYELSVLPENVSLSELKKIVDNNKGEILFVFSKNNAEKKEYTELAYQTIFLKNVEVMDLIDFYELIFIKEPLEILDEQWFVGNLRSLKIYDFIKRSFDIVLSLILIVVFSPIALLVGLAVKAGDGGPIFYMHKRAGLRNKEFMLFKFRSMVPVHNNFVWTLKNDDRITKVGHFIRRSHLDEIPQLINILKGDISFVGPRPEQTKVIDDISKEIPYYNVRSFVKPGLTGWAQIHYLASSTMDEVAEKLKYDLYYVKKRSFVLDILILIKTIKLFFVNPK